MFEPFEFYCCIPIDTNSTPLIADLFKFYPERDFMASVSSAKLKSFGILNSTPIIPDDFFNIDMVPW